MRAIRVVLGPVVFALVFSTLFVRPLQAEEVVEGEICPIIWIAEEDIPAPEPDRITSIVIYQGNDVPGLELAQELSSMTVLPPVIRLITVEHQIPITRVQPVTIEVPITKVQRVETEVPVIDIQVIESEVPVTNVVTIETEVPVTRTQIITVPVPYTVTEYVKVPDTVVVDRVITVPHQIAVSRIVTVEVRTEITDSAELLDSDELNIDLDDPDWWESNWNPFWEKWWWAVLLIVLLVVLIAIAAVIRRRRRHHHP